MQVATAIAGARFGRRLVGFLRQPPPSVDTARDQLAHQLETRSSGFLDLLDRAVWPIPSSPSRKLLEVAGVEPGDVRQLVEQSGLEGALERLQEVGVFVTYEEWAGSVPVTRGSSTFELQPQDFFNPLLRPDYFGSTGASRSSGTPVSSTFADMRSELRRLVVRWSAWDVLGVPTAVWFPVLPAGAGLNWIIRGTALRQPMERWFSQLDPTLSDIAAEKRMVSRLLPFAGLIAGRRIPRPEIATPTEPDKVLAWCLDAINRRGRALLIGYTSSIVALAQAAREGNHDLAGLIVNTSGEPMTSTKASILAAANATPVDHYAFTQLGGVAQSCLGRSIEKLHVWDPDFAVSSRVASHPDGQSINMFLWTTLLPTARTILVNVSNDDYGTVERDSVACPCPLGELGLRTTIGQIRGLSKVVAGGITLSPGVLNDLVDHQLPWEFGGTPGSYQFVEAERAGRTSVILRVDPSLDVDQSALLSFVGSRLSHSEAGLLASEVWRSDLQLNIERVAPVPTRSGKILAVETLQADGSGDP